MDYLPNIIFQGFTIESSISLLVTILLLFVSGFMSASEVAFFSLGPSDIKKLDDNKQADKQIKKLLTQPQKLLATILTGNNFVNIAIVIFSTFTTNKLLDFGDHTIALFVFQTVIITFLLLLFVEILPKIMATNHGISLARRNAPFLTICETIFYPISVLLVKSTDTLNKRIEKAQHNSISIDELETALKLTSNDNTATKADDEILHGIVNFGNISVSQVMTSRIDMTSININTQFNDLLKTVTENGYSRLPVYSGSDDNIRGILYVKDLLPYINKGNSFRWQSLVRNAYFVPETKKIDDLLTDFQKNKIHIAIVVDEFGGTSGLITMKDVLEEIIGDIRDEYDDDEPPLYKKIGDNVYQIEARIPINDFYKIENINEEDFNELGDDVETLAGLILEIKGEIPKSKDRIEYKNYNIEIEDADNRHIESVRVKVNPKTNNDVE